MANCRHTSIDLVNTVFDSLRTHKGKVKGCGRSRSYRFRQRCVLQWHSTHWLFFIAQQLQLKLIALHIVLEHTVLAEVNLITVPLSWQKLWHHLTAQKGQCRAEKNRQMVLVVVVLQSVFNISDDTG